MPMVKKQSQAAQDALVASGDGHKGALVELPGKIIESLLPNVARGRDFNAEAHGKTRCATWCAAVNAVLLTAGMGVNWKDDESVNGLLTLVEKVADKGEAYSFKEGK